jgi:hypothetical protein
LGEEESGEDDDEEEGAGEGEGAGAEAGLETGAGSGSGADGTAGDSDACLAQKPKPLKSSKYLVPPGPMHVSTEHRAREHVCMERFSGFMFARAEMQASQFGLDRGPVSSHVVARRRLCLPQKP